MKESLLLDVFIHSSFFLAIAALVIPILKRFRVPPVLGYLIAGVVLGPHGIGEFSEEISFLEYITLKDSHHIKILSELGLVFLLFVIGLELTPKKLWQMRSMVFGLGVLQVVVTATIIGGIAYAWENSIQASILLGLGLSLSSTAIITQWLHEKKLFSTEVGQTSFSILLLQDIAVIPILLLITVFTATSGDNLSVQILTVVVKMAFSVLAIILVSKWFLRPLFSFSSKYGGSEVFIALSFLVITVTSSIAGLAGMSMALGAFISGLLLAETQYSYEISSIIVPFKTILIGIFFMAFGMSIDIHFIFQRTFWLMASVFGLMVIKASIIYVLCLIWKKHIKIATETALVLSQAGEFGLMVVGVSLSANLMSNDVAQFMFLTIGLTMALTPMLTIFSQHIADYLHGKYSSDDNKLKETYEDNISNHIVIIGYGRMGKTISEIVSQQGIKILAFDKNFEKVSSNQAKNAPVYYGDATKKATLEKANIDYASCVVITVDDPVASKKIYNNIRERDKKTPIIIRSHKLDDFAEFQNESGLYIVPEYLSASLILAQKALQHNGYSEEDAYILAKDSNGNFKEKWEVK